jgi:tetratricopeptide (TPR) repeat protein
MLWNQHRHNQAAELLAAAMTVAEAPVVPPVTPPPPAEDADPDETPAPPPSPPPGSHPSERARLEAALPKFLEAAEAYPATDPGIAARYHAAAALAALGRHEEARDQYERVVDLAGRRIYGQMARLGRAQSLAALGHYDEAIAIYRELGETGDVHLPADGVLMHLGRTYLQAGRTAEASETFNRLVQEFPESLYAAEARERADR